jgi:Predicted integral membrane protein
VLTGSPPFAERNPQALIAAHATKTPEAISSRRSAIPPWLASLVMRCLEKRPADRPQTAAEIARILQAPEGSGSSPSITAHVPAHSKPANLAMTVVGVVVVLILAGAAVFTLRHRNDNASAADQTITSVAVLPLVNQSGSKEDEYFSDGMTDELATVLSRIPGLRVAVPNVSVFVQGKADERRRHRPCAERADGVRGSVRRAGGKLRITGQLTSVRDGLSLWSDSYERDASDVFAVQDEIARSIANKLELRLASTASKPDAGAGTGNIEAYDDYLRGRYFWNARGADNLRRAVEYFDKAITLDSGFARAYAARAIAYALLPEYSDSSPADALEKTRADGEKALAHDSTLAGAQTGIALALVHSRRWAEAEQAYQKAIALDPNYPTAHQWYGELLYNTSRLDSSVSETARARKLDPLAPILAAANSYALSLARRYPEALAVVKQGIELAPNLGVLHSVAAQIYVGLRDAPNARREMELAPGLTGSCC